MPLKIPSGLPAAKVLELENIFVMTEDRALHQDIRPLKILILNIMPTKADTEVQLLRLLSNSPLQLEVDLLQAESHVSRNTAPEYLVRFYKNFDEIKNNKYDGLIVTGAPVEKLPFGEVDYWPELCRIFEWSKKNVYSVFHICWGAQAGLYYHYGIKKRDLPQKLSGVFRHQTLLPHHPLLRGFDDFFLAPHSRYTEVSLKDVRKTPELEILAVSPEAGLYLAASRDGRRVFATGHSEYERDTLAKEYLRDLKKGINPAIPENYFPQDNSDLLPPLTWRAHASLLFTNWLNYYVYQNTPYDLDTL